jgi:hypothetical protein
MKSLPCTWAYLTYYRDAVNMISFRDLFKSPLFLRHGLLIGIVILALVVRLYKITSEPLDWHAFRQADTASVTREYVKHGIDLLVPRYHDLANIQSGEDNLEGYRMVEAPLVNALVAALVRSFGLPLIVTSRMVSAVFSLGTIVALYFLVERLSGKTAAALSALFLALLPYSVFYSRAILPEPAMLFFSTFSFVAFYWWLQNRKIGWYISCFVSLTLALLLKPSVVFLFPVYGGLILYKELPIKRWTIEFLLKKGIFYSLTLVPPFLLSVGVLAAWRKWIEQFPSGIPALDWLFNSNGIRFRPAWFRWLFWERLTKLIGGYVGVFFLPLNFFKLSKDLWVYASWGLGILIYLIVIATGNVQHDYYQVIAIPIICIAMGRGSELLYRYLTKRFHKNYSKLIVGAAIVATLVLSWQHVKGYYNINHYEYIVAGQAVDRLVPPDALVIAPAFGDTQFLFETNRRGWPIGFEIEDKIAKGAQYYVSTSYDEEARRLETEYEVIEKKDQYILIDLQRPKKST